MDCEESCPLPDKIPEIKESLKVAGMDVVTICSAIFFCFIMLTFVIFVCFKGMIFDLLIFLILSKYYLINLLIIVEKYIILYLSGYLT